MNDSEKLNLAVNALNAISEHLRNITRTDNDVTSVNARITYSLCEIATFRLACAASRQLRSKPKLEVVK